MASKISNLPSTASPSYTAITNIVKSPFSPGDDYQTTLGDLLSFFATYPIGGGADDSVQVQTAINAAAGNQEVHFTAGTYTFDNPIILSSQNSLSSLSSTIINAPIVSGDGFTDSVFYTPKVVGASTNLAATIVAGQPTAQVNSVSSFPVGGRVLLYRTDAGSSYLQVGIGITGSTDITAGGLYGGGGSLNGKTLILNTGSGATTLNLSGVGNAASESALIAAIVAQWPALSICKQGGATGKSLVLTAPSLAIGAGTANTDLGISATLNTLQMERPIALPYESGDVVYALTPTLNTNIDFGGATINALGGHRALWLPYNVDCTYKDFTVNCSTTWDGPDFDLGSLRSKFIDLQSVFVANTTDGFVIEGGGEADVLERCYAQGAFQTGFSIAGYDNTLRDCGSSGSAVYGLCLRENGPQDIFAAVSCKVYGGEFDGSQIGVQLRSNSNKNILDGVKASDCSVAGFSIATGSATTITVGTSYNKHTDCIADRCDTGFLIGDGATACTGNTYINCSSFGATSGGFNVQNPATGTVLVGCTAQDSASYGYVSNTDLNMIGCQSINNAGRGLYATGKVRATNFRSVGDGAAGGGFDAVKVDSTGSLTMINAHLEQASSGGGAGLWNGYNHTSSDSELLIGANIIFASASSGYGVLAQGSGKLRLRDVRVTGTGTGNFGLYINTGASVEIGPGCEFDAMATPLTLSSGITVSMVQTGGVAAVSATESLTFAQHYNTAIELASGAAADSTITTYAIPGMSWVCRNLSSHNLIIKTTNVGSITIAAGKSAIVSVNNSGVMTRVTADT